MGELRRRGVLAVVTGALAVGVLAGCTGSNGAGPSPSVTSTDAAADPTEAPTAPATATSTATATMPEVEKPTPPDAMRRDDIAGAEAAGTYFTELYRYVYATGDLADWKDMSHPDCVFCNSVIDGVGELVEAGEHVEGGEVQIVDVSASEPAPGYEFYQVNVRILHQPTAVVGESGTRPRSEAGDVLMKLAIGRVADGWVVREGEAADYAEG